MPREPDDLLTSREVARMLRVDASTVLRWVRLGQLPAIRTPGGHVRIRRSDAERLMMGEQEQKGY